jgi:hypothetical protein
MIVSFSRIIFLRKNDREQFKSVGIMEDPHLNMYVSLADQSPS